MGRHPFPIRDVARHAGVSVATVDRVLHQRPGVRADTAARVRRAIAELERDREAFELGGRTFAVDLVMHSPRRFSAAVWDAFERVIPTLRPAAFTIRPRTFERIDPSAIAAGLDDIAHRGSHAVVLKAPDAPEVTAAVGRLHNAGIPVITIVTDLPTSRRLAYVGVDNRTSGATAAYLIDRWLGPNVDDTGGRRTVLVTMSSLSFRGEEEREIGFRTTARRLAADWQILDLTETGGLADTISRDLDHLLGEHKLDAVYSIGGGNLATLETLKRRAHGPPVYIAHDLDGENRRLLSSGQLSAVLHHDLTIDAHRTCQLVMQAHGAVPGVPSTEPAPLQVITPYNIPTGPAF
ncbi:MAG: LacI family DNA-binding transcriptional regulator [Actinomycetota bacterium]